MLVALQSFPLPKYLCQPSYHSGPTTPSPKSPSLSVMTLEPPKGDLQQNLEGVPPTFLYLKLLLAFFFPQENDFFKL